MKIRSDMLTKALAKRHSEDFFLTEVKNGATHTSNELLKLDAMAIKKSWANPCISGYEVKVDRSDFTRDNKWPGYMVYCNQFSFVCPAGLIQPDELPQDVGLIYYNHEKQSLTTKRKALYRNIEIPSTMLYYIIMNRLENDRHPFFSSNRDYIEAYMMDKDDRIELGKKFGIKVTLELDTLREEIKQMKRAQERNQSDIALFRKLSTMLSNDYGIRIESWYEWEPQLRSLLSGGGMNPKIAEQAKQLLIHAETLAKLLNDEKERVKT